MVSPTTLTSSDGLGGWGPYYSYIWHSSIVGHEIYVPGNHPNPLNYSIKVNTSTNIWSDNSDVGHPTTTPEETINGVVHISLYNGTELLLRFVKPTVADWIPTGPPPNTNSEGSTSDCHLTYDPVQNWMQAFLNATLDSTDLVSTRNLYYRVRNATTNNVSADLNMNHTSGTHTYLNFDPTINGTYELQKVLTNPLEVLICDSAVVNTFSASDESENDPPPTPVFVPRSARRGNLNFW